MKHKNSLETFYLGDDRWKDFVHSMGEIIDSQKMRKVFVELVDKLHGADDIAQIILKVIGPDNSLNWIQSKVPALDGLSPIECVKSGGRYILRLKTCLMRMPS